MSSRLWFTRKKEKRLNDTLLLAATAIAVAYFFFKEYLFYAFIVILISLYFANRDTKKEFKNRQIGLKTEDSIGEWLQRVLEEKGYSVRRSVKMRYGDIDIYLPDINMVIDVKSFRKIDDRLLEPKIAKSMERQILHVNARIGVYWLPNCPTKEIRNIGDINGIEIYVVSGKGKIFELIEKQ